eukprot:COSAG01_NODE_7482_length_3192_cov_1.969285_2_plen_553_part_00
MVRSRKHGGEWTYYESLQLAAEAAGCIKQIVSSICRHERTFWEGFEFQFVTPTDSHKEQVTDTGSTSVQTSRGLPRAHAAGEQLEVPQPGTSLTMTFNDLITGEKVHHKGKVLAPESFQDLDGCWTVNVRFDSGLEAKLSEGEFLVHFDDGEYWKLHAERHKERITYLNKSPAQVSVEANHGIDTTSVCTICQMTFSSMEGETEVITLSCKDTFCVSCFTNLEIKGVAPSTTCPNCKRSARTAGLRNGSLKRTVAAFLASDSHALSGHDNDSNRSAYHAESTYQSAHAEEHGQRETGIMSSASNDNTYVDTRPALAVVLAKQRYRALKGAMPRGPKASNVQWLSAQIKELEERARSKKKEKKTLANKSAPKRAREEEEEDEPADPAEKTVGRGKKRMAAGASKVSSASVTTGASTKTTSAVTAVAAAITVAEQQEQQEEPMAQQTHAEALLAQDSRAPQSSTGIDATTSSGEAPVIATTDPRVATSTDSDGEFVREAAGSNANTPPASTADMDAPAISSNVLAVGRAPMAGAPSTARAVLHPVCTQVTQRRP